MVYCAAILAYCHLLAEPSLLMTNGAKRARVAIARDQNGCTSATHLQLKLRGFSVLRGSVARHGRNLAGSAQE